MLSPAGDEVSAESGVVHRCEGGDITCGCVVVSVESVEETAFHVLYM